MFFRNFFLKIRCINCQRFEPAGLCRSCLNQFAQLPFTICPICKSSDLVSGNCQECLRRIPLFQELFCLGIYSGVLKNLIYDFKYEKNRHYSLFLGTFLAELVRKKVQETNLSLVTSIPLSSVKLKSRGFNQSCLLARKVAKELAIPYRETLIRNRDTKPQFSLTSEERRENLREAFTLKSNVQGKTILLVDDIFTTGTTIQEAASVLRENNSGDIYVAVLARSLG